MRAAVKTVIAAAAIVVTSAIAYAGGDWNDAGIQWKTYNDGLAQAKTESKPVMLVVYTDWCPHCTNYSQVFHDPKVVEKSKQFVMIRINKDQDEAKVTPKYAPDGQYIPRTVFLNSAGELQPDLHEQRDNYKYFYNESDPASVLRGMDAAIEKLAKKS